MKRIYFIAIGCILLLTAFFGRQFLFTQDLSTQVDSASSLPEIKVKKLAFPLDSGLQNIYLRVVNSDTVFYAFYKDNSLQLYSIQGEMLKTICEGCYYTSTRTGSIKDPLVLVRNKVVMSMTDSLRNQELMIYSIPEKRNRVYNLPHELHGEMVSFGLNDVEAPLFYDDSTLILRIYYPSLTSGNYVEDYYQHGIDAVFKLEEDTLIYLTEIGHFPEMYQNFNYILQDYYPARARRGDSIYYSFKHSNEIFVYYRDSGTNNWERSITEINSTVDVEPIVVEEEEWYDVRYLKKLVREPGYLSLKYHKLYDRFYRVYKPSIVKDDSLNLDLYANDFKLFEYTAHFNILDKYHEGEIDLKAMLYGENNLLYFRENEDVGNIDTIHFYVLSQ